MGTSTSRFGVGKRESHDATDFYARFRPPGSPDEPGGVIVYWAVDDVQATYDRLLGMGAKPHAPVTPRGDQGFITASVVDPFGNVLGVMENPHYLASLGQS